MSLIVDVVFLIYVELRRLTKEHGLVSEIVQQLNSLTKDIDMKFVLELFRTGEFVFFFDGYDEVPLAELTFVTRESGFANDIKVAFSNANKIKINTDIERMQGHGIEVVASETNRRYEMLFVEHDEEKLLKLQKELNPCDDDF